MELGLSYIQMNKTKMSKVGVIFFLLAVLWGCMFTPAALAVEAATPEQIILTWTADPATSQTITWLNSNNSPAQVQYIKDSEYNDSFDPASQIEANGVAFDSTNYRYSTNITGLTPNTKYVYRVGNENAWSEVLSFSTAGNKPKFSFMYMGDVQAGYAEWGNVLNSVYQVYPQIKFSLLGGDLTDNGHDENEWGQFLNAARGVFSRIPVLPTIGNHDGVMYSNFFALPDNGPVGLKQEFYSFDYGNAHFVVLNSNNNTNAKAKQWLQADLQGTTKTWKFAMFHHPAYKAFEDYKTIDESIRTNWVPILEQNGVDMVFVGHQHEYMRTYPMYQGAVQIDPQGYGIVYVMGNAGSKVYGGCSGFSHIAREESGSNYQILEIDGNVLTMTAKKTNDELIESYTITKSLLAAPALTADQTQNGVGKEIELGFTDDAAWRAAIMDVTVNGTSIAGKYSVFSGSIKIEGDVFESIADYAISVKAVGYAEAVVTQPIIADNLSWFDGYISTVVGNGTRGKSGDGGPASEAQLRDAYDVVRDNSGNLYIADSSSYRVCMVAAVDGTYYGIPMTAGNIYTVAGNGSSGYSGDDGPASEAQLKSIYGLAVDSSGNLYINDRGNYRIRKVEPGGIITTVAGNGNGGYSGDGEPAISAQLNTRCGLAVDNAGNLYLPDGVNNRVRMVAATSGMFYGIAATAGNIYTIVGDGTAAYSGDGGPAISAQIGSAYDVTFDNSGNMYIADYSNYRVRKIDSSGIITTVIGNGTAAYSGDGGPAINAGLRPYGLAVDSNGAIYIADMVNCCVRMVDINGIITTVAGGNGSGYAGDGGPATSAKLQPYGLALDSAGGLYIADQSGYCVRYVQAPSAALPSLSSLSLSGSPDLTYSGMPLTYDLTGLTLTATDQNGAAYDISGKTLTWTVKSGPAALNGSILTIVRGGTVEITAQVLGAVTDIFDLKVQTGTLPVINLKVGDINTLAGIGISGYDGDGGPAINGQLSNASDVAVDMNGNIFIVDQRNNRIRMVAAITGQQYGINMTAGNIYTVAGTGTRGYSGDGGPATDAQLGQVEAVAVDGAGNLFIAHLGENDYVRKVDPSGIIATVTQTDGPRGLAVDSSGNLYIGCGANNFYGIRMLAAETGTKHGIPMTAGNIYTIAGTEIGGYSGDGGPATGARIYSDGRIALDKAGNLYIADVYNNRVRKVDPGGIITTIAGNGTSGYSGDNGQAVNAKIYPIGIAADSIGNIYISGEKRIRKIDVNGIITTVAGNGTAGYSGDGGPAINAQMSVPWGMDVDSTGNLYITDRNNCCVRYVKLVPDEALDLTSLSLSGSPALSYSGTPITYDLGGLTLTGTDQSGAACDLSGQTVAWAVHSGPAEVSGSTLTITGSGTVEVSVSVYDINSNILSLIVSDNGAQPPVLTADSSEKVVGQDDVIITFSDDPAWRAAINSVSINGTVLDAGKYSTDTAGKIILAANVINKAGDYVILFKATGYSDISIVQSIVDITVILEIMGEGVTNHLSFTMGQLQGMDQYRHLYSTLNKWPTKKWYVAEGVKLKDLLKLAGIKEDATLINFMARDGYSWMYTVQELQDDTRHLFPHFMEPSDGHLAGSAALAEEAETILALRSADSDNFDYMNDSNALHLIIGQRAVTEQLNDGYVKYVNKVEVSTTPLSKWESPQAEPAGGNIPTGTLVTLSTPDMNTDKIYYTTDGSTPTINSTMYNPIGKEWWSSRSAVLNSINHPIIIEENTIIKAIAIGTGKEDSDIATFIYQVPPSANPPLLTADSTDNTVGQDVILSFDDDAAWRAAISGITVDGSAVDGSKFIVAEGTITLDKTLFAVAKDYAVVVKAAGYSDTSVTQVVNEAAQIIFTIDGNGVDTPRTYTLGQLQSMTPTTVLDDRGRSYKGVAINDLLTVLGTDVSNCTVVFKVKDGDTDPANVSAYSGHVLAYERDGAAFNDVYGTETTHLQLVYANAKWGIKYIYGMTINEPVLLTPPLLAADSTGNTVGQDVTLSFDDDAAWRAAITDVTVDGISIAGKYSLAEGTLTINAGVFTVAGDYAIAVKAAGYGEAAVIQHINRQDIGAYYTLTPITDIAYQSGVTPDGISAMAVNSGVSGMRYFGVQIASIKAHSGLEATVFTHQRNGVQLSLNVTKADFDLVNTAQAGFNVQAGDVVMVYIVDDLTNALDFNPTILQ